jgi:hypothetical protein
MKWPYLSPSSGSNANTNNETEVQRIQQPAQGHTTEYGCQDLIPGILSIGRGLLTHFFAYWK